MTFVVNGGQIVSIDRATPIPVGTVTVSSSLRLSYADIWRTQPQVRTVVSFLARNIAQLKVHTYRRTSDTDRERLADHPLARLLAKPNPRTTRYRFFEALMSDYGIHENALWLKMRGDGSSPQQLLRLPPELVQPVGDSWIWPEKYRLTGARGKVDFDADQVVHFRGYNPGSALWGMSPLETLRRILTEEYEAGRWREQLWRNGARFPGYIKRPKEAGPWSSDARERFINSWKGLYTGDGPAAGGTPVLEDGMEFFGGGVTPEQAQYLETRKLTREEVAAAYHIPAPFVGILEHATFSNIEEQHRNLYQDTLGPYLSMISEEIMLQLLPDLDASSDVYCEFNLNEKLKGDFAQEAASLQAMVGRPVMTANEGRARLNLPAIDGGDELMAPLNMGPSGQAASPDAPPKSRRIKALAWDNMKAAASQGHRDRAQKVLVKFFRRQRAVVLSALGSKAGAAWWDRKRWDTELTDDLYRLAAFIGGDVGGKVADQLGGSYDEPRTAKFLQAVAESRAGAINSTTRDQLQAILDGDDDDPGPALAGVFDAAEENRAPGAALTLVTTLTAFATTEAARQVGGSNATKTWVTSSGNPRPEHAAMDGETVGIDEKFSNGAAWPGDPVLGVDGVAGCTCDVEVRI